MRGRGKSSSFHLKSYNILMWDKVHTEDGKIITIFRENLFKVPTGSLKKCGGLEEK
jgi:hypothetical protein